MCDDMVVLCWWFVVCGVCGGALSAVLMSRKIDVVALAPKGKVAKMSARPHLHLALRSNFMVSLLLLPTLYRRPRGPACSTEYNTQNR